MHPIPGVHQGRLSLLPSLSFLNQFYFMSNQIKLTNTPQTWDLLIEYPLRFHKALIKNDVPIQFKQRIEKAYYYNMPSIEKKIYLAATRPNKISRITISYFDALCLLYLLQHYPLAKDYLQMIIDETIAQIDKQL